MTGDDQLRAWALAFAETVIQQTEAMRTGDIRIGNVLARRRASLFRKLRAAGDRGREALVPLFKHERPDVRVTVAAWLLRYRTADAIEILRRQPGPWV